MDKMGATRSALVDWQEGSFGLSREIGIYQLLDANDKRNALKRA